MLLYRVDTKDMSVAGNAMRFSAGLGRLNGTLGPRWTLTVTYLYCGFLTSEVSTESPVLHMASLLFWGGGEVREHL